MHIAFCDDEPLTIYETIQQLVDRLAVYGIAADIKTYTNPAALIADIVDNNISYDMYFLDIEMPEASGISIAQQIRRIHPRAIILFLSAYVDFGDKICRVHADAYLYKQGRTEDAVLDIDCAIRKYLQRISTYTFSISGSEEKTVFTEDIVYMETLKRRINVHMTDGTSFKINSRYTLAYFEGLDDFREFYRISRSSFINCRNIKTVRFCIQMITGKTFYPGRNVANQVHQRFLMSLREDDFM